MVIATFPLAFHALRSSVIAVCFANGGCCSSGGDDTHNVNDECGDHGDNGGTTASGGMLNDQDQAERDAQVAKSESRRFIALTFALLALVIVPGMYV